jgi:hypothetical protein
MILRSSDERGCYWDAARHYFAPGSLMTFTRGQANLMTAGSWLARREMLEL